MKDRWKIFWTCVAFAIVLGIVVGSLTASFKKVELRQYGILYYTVFSKVDNQIARANGNYLVGLDYDFHKFPSGIILLQFKTMSLTKDMSMVQVQGIFTGKLILSEVTSMYATHGMEYNEFLKASVQEYVRQALETYSLSQLVSNREGVQNNVKGAVCMQVQAQYPWIQCDFVSLGKVGTNIPEPNILEVQQSFELAKIDLLNKQIQSQKLYNFYSSGGFQILRNMEAIDSQLFVQVCSVLAGGLNQLSLDERIAGAQYSITGQNFPVLNNSVRVKL